MTVTISPSTPPDTGESPGLGAGHIRGIKQAILDLFNLPPNVALATPIINVTALSPSAAGADNTTALQAAIDGSPDGSLLFLSGGTFNLDGTVTINRNLAVIGAGRGQTILNFTSGRLAVVTNSPVTIANLTVNSTLNGALTVTGTSGLGNGDSLLDHLYVTSTGGDAISILGAYQTIITECRCNGQGGSGSGIRLANSFAADSGGYTITGCILNGTLAGLRHDSGAGLTFSDNVIFAPGTRNQYGLYMVFAGSIPAAETIIANNDISTSNVVGIWVDSATGYAAFQITGNNIRGDQDTGGGITVTNGSVAALTCVGNVIQAGTGKAVVVDLGANGITFCSNHVQHVGTDTHVGLNLRSGAANGVVVGNQWYGGILPQNQVTIDPAALIASILLKDCEFLFAGLPGTPVQNGSMVYVEDGTPSTSPLTGGGAGAVAIRQSGTWRGL